MADDMTAFYRHLEDTHLDVHPQYRLESTTITNADLAGSINPDKLSTHMNSGTAIPSGTLTTTSASYVAWPTGEQLSVSLTKLSSSTAIYVFGTGTFFHSAGSQHAQIAVRVDSTDYRLSTYYFNAASDHRTWAGVIRINGLSAGSKSFALRAQVSGGTLTADTNDFNALTVIEAM